MGKKRRKEEKREKRREVEWGGEKGREENILLPFPWNFEVDTSTTTIAINK